MIQSINDKIIETTTAMVFGIFSVISLLELGVYSGISYKVKSEICLCIFVSSFILGDLK